jgi:hypothetical protein
MSDGHNHTDPWSNAEYIYIDDVPHCYTKYSHLCLVHMRGGLTVDISALSHRRIRMPSKERQPDYISPDMRKIYDGMLKRWPKRVDE